MIDKIIAFENGELDNEGIIELFADLIKTGQVWSLQGSYRRMAQNLIDNDLINRKGIINWSKYRELVD